MRAVIVAGSAAVLAAVAAGSAPAGSSSPGVGRAPLGVHYLFHAKFKVEYEVDWMTKAGSEDTECASWRVDRGSSKVVVTDAPWVQKIKRKGKVKKVVRNDGIPGSITIPGSPPRKGVKAMWADGSALGRAKATASRTWIQQGGANWSPSCGGSRPEPFRPFPSDCRTLTVASRAATFLPQTRRQFDTLWDVINSQGNRAALMFSMPAPTPYKTCRTHGAAPGLPAGFGFWMGKTDIRDLSKAHPGETTQVHFETSGDCTYDIGQDESCTFRLELTLDVTPREPGTPFP